MLAVGILARGTQRMVDKKTPDGPVDPIEDAVQRSMPRNTRPRLCTEAEAALASTESKAAAQYASMESITQKLHDLADEIELSDDDLIPDDEPRDALPEVLEFEDSLVHNIEEVRAQLIKDLKPDK